MSEERTVPVYIFDESGEEVQVGKATPNVDGVRTIKLFKTYSGVSKKDVHFGDEPSPAAPISEGPDASLAAEPIDEGIETVEVETHVEEEEDDSVIDEVEELPEGFEPVSNEDLRSGEDDDQQ